MMAWHRLKGVCVALCQLQWTNDHFVFVAHVGLPRHDEAELLEDCLLLHPCALLFKSYASHVRYCMLLLFFIESPVFLHVPVWFLIEFKQMPNVAIVAPVVSQKVTLCAVNHTRTCLHSSLCHEPPWRWDKAQVPALPFDLHH